ncbi:MULTISPECIES: hypothetical protein [unclassified Mesorhizobium]|uniref:hypothetical protein n=1 Tax=unclassified Mesorhizobium TaxID=325217 RepID=UPI000FCCD1D6|nr:MULTISPECIES: hypothetical protein [unclassified Mesorhizobium]TGP21411.1 hypothetical protein EN874_023980 [Mesorhizobium sp. M1D.F.Ca.ET.231.01.1.1]TGP28858.1 hypothetical protein EN877_22360 [Mesorhizobium sp. M1D.F.Ca.ET.234.01.1.1]TGS43326.1 hypothetical protein EN827_22355 [Mesorhizobium sp. M1D.F.Ca.ET.184.01.1.1]TGS59874.1 hypothetical protein EN826_022355 [Mesorhizobium sp. M1D.F.Ca.ET.183.01.1.1]
MTEYVVKLRFWLRCWDSMTIDAGNDADAIAAAPQLASEMMLSASYPESIEVDERREGLISYIDSADMEGRNEIAEAIEFDGARPLFPKAAALISRLAQLNIDDVQSEADLRELLAGFALEARHISPDVPPWPGSPHSCDT